MARKVLQVKEVTVSEMADLLSGLESYNGFITIVAETEQNSKLFSPVKNFGKGVQISKVEKFTLNFGGKSYQDKVREVTNDPEFVAQKPFGKTIINKYILQKDSDPTVKYFRTYKCNAPGMARSWDKRFLVNGRLADDEMTAKIKNLYRPTQFQAVAVRDFTITNVIAARFNRIDYIVRR